MIGGLKWCFHLLQAFYLPGSLDVNDKQMDQWNLTPPPLYLWSRPDWTSKHKAIALEHGHISGVQEASRSDENVPASGFANENNEIEGDLPMPLNDLPVIDEDPGRMTDKAKANTKRRKKEGPAHDNDGTDTKNKEILNEKSSNQNLNKRNWRDQEFQMEKHDDKRSLVTSRRDEAQKLDDRHSLASSRRDQAQKLEDKHSLAPSHQDQGQKHEDKHSLAPYHRDQAQKLEDKQSLAPSRQDQGQKLEDKHSLAPSRQDQGQKLEDKHSLAPYRRDQAQIRDDKHSLVSSRQDRAKKPDDKHYLASSRQEQAQKLDNKHAFGLSDQVQGQKHDDKHSPAPSRQDQTQKHDNIHSLAPSRQDEAEETLHSDLSYWNDIGHSHLERRHNPISEGRFLNTTYRQLDGPNLSTPTYSMRPDHIPYSSYERVSTGPYFDEMRSRGGYPMVHHEPGLTRYNPADTPPVNRTSTSTMQRYAPRLDELNHTRMNNLGRSELDELNHTRMSNLGRPEPPIASRGMVGYGPPIHGPGFRMDHMGFAPGPYHPYTQHNSSGGWLNE